MVTYIAGWQICFIRLRIYDEKADMLQPGNKAGTSLRRNIANLYFSPYTHAVWSLP